MRGDAGGRKIAREEEEEDNAGLSARHATITALAMERRKVDMKQPQTGSAEDCLGRISIGNGTNAGFRQIRGIKQLGLTLITMNELSIL